MWYSVNTHPPMWYSVDTHPPMWYSVQYTLAPSSVVQCTMYTVDPPLCMYSVNTPPPPLWYLISDAAPRERTALHT